MFIVDLVVSERSKAIEKFYFNLPIVLLVLNMIIICTEIRPFIVSVNFIIIMKSTDGQYSFL